MAKKYNLINDIFGWICFIVAAVVYIMTVEPTASFWDCGEFITSAYKLEVGHPPGAPFFMLTGNFFSLFASDPMQVAKMINIMSAVLSALTILFLFWTITHLAKKLIYTDSSKEMTLGQQIAIIGSGLIGALTYTFTDTFWFSAVEGEVYAYSSMLTALVFWLILKWENRADQPGADKWLVLIAYMMGLSIGVHLLNLLCIPAIALVYYFKKSPNANMKGTLIALAASFFLIVVLMYGIIPGFSKIGGWFELLFVNSFGMPYNSGVFVYLILLFASIVWALYETMSTKGNLIRSKVAFLVSLILSGAILVSSSALLWLALVAVLAFVIFKLDAVTAKLINTSALCLLVILIGYSSFALIPIRSAANTPMDQNSPEHVFALESYLNREQYGDRPLFYGNTYASKPIDVTEGKPKYDKVVKKSPDEKDKYVVTERSREYKYNNNMLFPRMHSSDEERQHILGFRLWGGITDKTVPPTFLENVQYLFNYQINYMYFRYFMWNFSGRQNDIQGTGNINNGNWITGIGFIDEHILNRGPQDNLPPSIAENKAHNVYYAIPFILGIIGLGYQLTRKRKGEQQFLVTFMLFFMTGLAIVLYLNQQPFEPRERDYAYAGSFYAYCIWIGLAVAGLWHLLSKKLPSTVSAALVTVVLLAVPVQMACQNWDDHDRSGRYTTRELGRNYLRGCEKNAILFTMGDNDTFPLWYAQDVEGFRTDVRVCNLSYLMTDWYVDQMKRQAYDSEPLPITWASERYQGETGIMARLLSRRLMEHNAQETVKEEGKNTDILLRYMNYDNYFDTTEFKKELPLDKVMELLKTKDTYVPRDNMGIVDPEEVNVPSTRFVAPIDSAQVDWAKFGVDPSKEFVIDFGDNMKRVIRNDIMVMEMLNNINKDNWKRPIYYAFTIGSSPISGIRNGVLEGINYRITPSQVAPMTVNTDAMYRNLVEEYTWESINNPDVYLDANVINMCQAFRNMFAQLINNLLVKGDKERALKALDRCVEVLPGSTVPHNDLSTQLVSAYYAVGQPEKAEKIIDEILHHSSGALQWYARMDQRDMQTCAPTILSNVSTEMDILGDLQKNNDARYRQLMDKLMIQIETFMSNGVRFFSPQQPEMYPPIQAMSLLQRGAIDSTDTAAKTYNEGKWNDAVTLIQKYDPQVWQALNRGGQQPDSE